MTDDVASDGVRARLAVLANGPRAGFSQVAGASSPEPRSEPGWVPSPPEGSLDAEAERPASSSESGSEPRETGPGAAIRERAMASAVAAYTAAHGHPLDASELEGAPDGARWGTRTRAAVFAAVALVALGAVVMVRSASQAPSALVPYPTGVSDNALAAGEQSVDVVVHVVGQVRSPGVVHLPAGSRVWDAISAAGGPSDAADLEAVNLARVLSDGEQLYVPEPGDGVMGSVVGAAGDPRLDLNAADGPALEALPGIGPVIAQRILDWRTEHGRFSTVEELNEVRGIGQAVLEQVRDLVRVG